MCLAAITSVERASWDILYFHLPYKKFTICIGTLCLVPSTFSQQCQWYFQHSLVPEFISFHLQSHVALPSCPPDMMSFCIDDPRWHPYYHATCVGQAKNPGPFPTVRLAVTNPTAVFKRVSELLGFHTHLISLSETSATLPVQQTVTADLDKHHYRSFWSPPVHSNKETSKPSFRGAALGTMIATCLPSRVLRADIPQPLIDSQRFSAAMVTMGSVEVLVISLYGFAKKVEAGKKLNDILLGYVCQLLQNIHVPFLVAGDFNEPIIHLPIWQFFANLGAVEAHSFHNHVFGYPLEPTCAGATYNDSVIFHPMLAKHIRSMKVSHEHAINIHSPLFVDFDFSEKIFNTVKVDIPQSWAPFAPPKDDIAEAYNFLCNKSPLNTGPFQTPEEANEALCLWSKRIEAAVDFAVQKQHATDPIKHPVSCLKTQHRGRGSKLVFKNVPAPQGVKPDRPNGFTPDCEVFSITSKLKVKQVRRLMSLQRLLKSIDSASNHPTLQWQRTQQVQTEWTSIRKARGYGHSWENWILGFEAVNCIPHHCPPPEFLDLCIQITQVDCKAECRLEYSRRVQAQNISFKLMNLKTFCAFLIRLPKPNLQNLLLKFRRKSKLMQNCFE